MRLEIASYKLPRPRLCKSCSALNLNLTLGRTSFIPLPWYIGEGGGGVGGLMEPTKAHQTVLTTSGKPRASSIR